MATKPSVQFLAIPATDLTPIENRMAVDRLRSLIATNGAYIKSQDGVADEFSDETGVSPIPSYDSGDRTGSITVTTTGTLNGGSAANLVNGAITNNSAGSVWFNAQSASGLIIKFDMGSSVAINEATFYANAAHDQGVWKWQGSSDDSTYTDIGSSFNLGNNQATQVQTELNNNTTAYRYYRLLGVSGTMSSSPYLREMNFQTYGVSSNTTYEATGDYYHNPPGGSLSVITNVVGAVYSHSEIHSSGYTSANGFNGDLTNRWATGGANSGYMQIDLGAGNEKTLVKIIPHATGGADNQAIDGFIFSGSNDNSTFTTLVTMANGTATTVFGTGAAVTSATFNFTNTTAYRYYRFNITQAGIPSSRGLCTCYDLQGYEAVTDPASMTIVSKTFTAQTAPSEASLVLLHQPVDSVTLNVDILAYISRDNGTTYTQGTLASGGEYSTGINILTLNGLDISAQPSGTNMKYKIVTANSKEQRFHGSWLQWS